jgi:uncharacterized protein (TIGR02246 family)
MRVEGTGPESVSERMVEFLAAGDIDGVIGLYEADAVFIEVDGVSRGLTEIRSALQRFAGSGLTLTLNESAAFEMGDLALVHWTWTVSDEEGATLEGTSAEVLRRQADGSWKFVIDNSDGAAMVGRV